MFEVVNVLKVIYIILVKYYVDDLIFILMVVDSSNCKVYVSFIVRNLNVII